MDNNEGKKSIWLDIRFIICLLIVGVLVYLIASTLIHFNSIGKDEQRIPYGDKWTYESGSVVNMDELRSGQEQIIHKRTDAEQINDRMLCFFSKNIYFSVYMDGELIYDFHPDPPKIFSRAYGIFPHAVNLPVTLRDGDLKIVIHNIYEDNPGFIRDMVLDNGGQFLIEVLQNDLMDFLLCLLVFAFGTVLFVIGLIGRYFKDERYEIISMGTFAMVSSLWVISETSVLSLLTGAPVAVHFIDYISLDLLALPGVIFVASATRFEKKFPIYILAGLTALKIGYSIFSTCTGGKDYHQLLVLTHILLGITVAVVIVMVALGVIRKRIRNGLVSALFAVLLFSLVMGIVDIVRYMTMPHEYVKASYYKYALFLFIFVCGVYEFVRMSEMSRRGQYAEIMEELAYKDGLTGMLNRLAFNREIESLKTDSTLIMLDMNYLKRVNDEMGHDVGDMYITKIADLMHESFCHGEKCFRIGGDEFFVLADYKSTDPLYGESLKRMKELVDEFNSSSERTIPLSIAHGYAEFVTGSDIEEYIRLADQRMYEMKAEMKLQMG